MHVLEADFYISLILTKIDTLPVDGLVWYLKYHTLSPIFFLDILVHNNLFDIFIIFLFSECDTQFIALLALSQLFGWEWLLWNFGIHLIFGPENMNTFKKLESEYIFFNSNGWIHLVGRIHLWPWIPITWHFLKGKKSMKFPFPCLNSGKTWCLFSTFFVVLM